MHDALAYQRDTEIADVEEEWEAAPTVITPPPPPTIGRVPTGELTMQVHVEGAYHRRTPDLAMTACGHHRIAGEFCPTRREELKHPLSRDCGCFTPFELSIADAAEAKEYEP